MIFGLSVVLSPDEDEWLTRSSIAWWSIELVLVETSVRRCLRM